MYILAGLETVPLDESLGLSQILLAPSSNPANPVGNDLLLLIVTVRAKCQSVHEVIGAGVV